MEDCVRAELEPARVIKMSAQKICGQRTHRKGEREDKQQRQKALGVKGRDILETLSQSFWCLNFLILRDRPGMEDDPRNHTKQFLFVKFGVVSWIVLFEPWVDLLNVCNCPFIFAR